jgi:hypothetical protein
MKILLQIATDISSCRFRSAKARCLITRVSFSATYDLHRAFLKALPRLLLVARSTKGANGPFLKGEIHVCLEGMSEECHDWRMKMSSFKSSKNSERDHTLSVFDAILIADWNAVALLKAIVVGGSLDLRCAHGATAIKPMPCTS